MPFILRKGPSGPGFDAEFPPPGGGLLRVPVGGGEPEEMRGSVAGQLTYWKNSSGLWLPTTAGPSDGQFPVWNEAQENYDFASPVHPGQLEYFDDSLDPDALYRFDRTIDDFSGNGFDLSVTAGTIGYAQVFPGKWGVLVSNATTLARSVSDALLANLGDISMMMVGQWDNNSTSQPLMCYAATGETEATNTLWLLQISLSANPPRRLSWLSERGGGTDDTATSSGNDSMGLIHNVTFVGARRQNNVITWFQNGEQLGPSSAALSAPTGGSSSRLHMGCSPGTGCIPGIIFTSQIINRACTNAEFLAAYNQSMGPAFGRL